MDIACSRIAFVRRIKFCVTINNLATFSASRHLSSFNDNDSRKTAQNRGTDKLGR